MVVCSRRFLIGNTSITTEYNTSNSQVIGSSSYVLRLSGQNVLTFNSVQYLVDHLQ
jgi:hypothetical protein